MAGKGSSATGSRAALKRRLLALPGGDPVVAALRSLRLTVGEREPCLVTRDRASGGWRHRYRWGVLVTPEPSGATWRAQRAMTEDIFFHRYTARPGDTVLEIGAGCGTETVTLAALVGAAGRVVACEAHPWTATLLKRTRDENGLENVTVVAAAASDRAGTVMISDLDPRLNQLNSIVSGGIVPVPAVTLDDLIDAHGLETVDLLKMNIEGAERAALMGLERAAPRVRHAVIGCHDFIADETGDESFRTLEAVTRRLHDIGFKVAARGGDVPPPARDYVYAWR